jgi:capsular exopolysaccharide synthesis family protein
VLAYARDQVEMRGQQSEEAQHFLQDKLVEIKQRLEKAQIALANYRRQEGIATGQISLDGVDAQALDQFSSMSRDLIRARAERVGLESQVELIRKHQYTSLPAVTNNPAIQDLDRELTGLYSEDAALATQFKSDSPPLVQIQTKIRDTQGRFAAAVSKAVDGIQSAYQQAVDKENQLQAKLDKQRADNLDPDDTATQYVILQRDVDTNGELYSAVLAQFKDVAIPSGAGNPNVSVINSAEVPAAPSSPNKLREYILAIAAGLSGGIGLAFVFGFLDNALKNPEEAENYLRVPSLGVVPDFSSINGRHSPQTPSHLADDRSPMVAPDHGGELASLHRSYPVLGQAYGNLRTALMLSRAGAPPQVTLITSAANGEGKTVTAVNTAVTLAQLGARTLLIDANLRSAGCHHVLAVDNYLGLTEVLTGSRELHDEVIQMTEVDNLHILTSGAVPPNPAELLGSKKMAETLIHLREHYEYIVIDSSPVLPASDSLRLAKLADGVVLVANGVRTPRQQVKSACARLGYARAKILGVVLNKMKSPGSVYRPPEDYYPPENNHAAARQRPV